MATPIGSITVSVDEKTIASPGALPVFTAAVKDATGTQLLTASEIISAEIAIMERVIDRETGRMRFEPAEPKYQLLLPHEFELFDTLQPSGQTSTVQFTFRFQPNGRFFPLFAGFGIFEVWFRFKRRVTDEDAIRTLFICNVGGVSAPNAAQ